MFSVQQKRDISDAVQKILRATKHPELHRDGGEVKFALHVVPSSITSARYLQRYTTSE